MLRRTASALYRGALWGAAVAAFERWAIDRGYHVGLEPPVHRAELFANTALWIAVAAVVLAGVAALRAGRSGSAESGSERTLSADRAARAAGIAAMAIAAFLHLRPGAFGGGAGGVAGAVAAVVTLLMALVVFVGLDRAAGNSMGRRAVLAGVALIAAWGWLSGPGAVSASKGRTDSRSRAVATEGRPNILLIVTDTERADVLGCYGSDRGASPATDRVARDGVVFERHMAQAAWTLPSTASLLTGQFPSSHGAVATGRRIAREAPSLAAALHAAGYRTAAFTENFHILPRNGFGRGFETFDAAWLPWVFDRALVYRVAAHVPLPLIHLAPREAFPDSVTSPGQVYWDAARLTDRALAWLERTDDRPFFAYLHYMGPHGPYGPPEYLLDGPKPRVAVADHPREMGGGLPLGKPGREVDDETLRTMRTLYAADVRYVEEHIGRLLDWLDRTGRADETVVVLTSDHGEEFYDHRAWNHGASAFDEVIRVPLVIRAPGVARDGLRVRSVTRHVDVAPTLLDLAGVAPPNTMQGRSLRLLLEGRALRPLPALTEVCAIRPPGCKIVALTDSTAKFVRVELGDRVAESLFDLVADPGETHDVAARRADEADRLLREVTLWERAAALHAGRGESVPIDPATMQRLKSLGYVN